jgi:hypothetical protein
LEWIGYDYIISYGIPYVTNEKNENTREALGKDKSGHQQNSCSILSFISMSQTSGPWAMDMSDRELEVEVSVKSVNVINKVHPPICLYSIQSV